VINYTKHIKKFEVEEMNSPELSTKFASAARSADNEINSDIRYFQTLEGLANFLNAISSIVLVLNSNRQIVYSNRSILSITDLGSLDEIYGKRPGELLDCIYAYENDAGCGTSVFCRNCGGVKSILKCLEGTHNSMECSILRNNNKPSFDLRVCSHPFSANNSKYVVFTAEDISHEKRRQVLEKSFFHDIANSLTGVEGYGDLMEKSNPEEASKWLKNLRVCTSEAINEIHSHKSLLAAEDGDLNIEKNIIDSLELLNSMKNIFEGYSTLRNLKDSLIIESDSQKLTFQSDFTLLSRILINLIKNAIEASNGKPVTIGCNKGKSGAIQFFVNNRSYIEQDTQSQIFKRSFSTKGKGRGIGTYSVKLFTEKYLGGKVYFTSNEKDGTTFFVELPI